MPAVKLTVVMTHPVQYFAPWFRYITAECPEIELTVLYATQPTPQQQGASFGRPFVWDVPLLEGYRCRVVRPARPIDKVHSGSFRGVDVPEICEAVCDSRPDVVLIAGWYSITLLRTLWYCLRHKIPVLYRGDTNLGNSRTGLKKIVWAARTWLLLRLFSGYLCVGERTREYLRAFGLPPSRIFDAPHFVDNEFFAELAAPFQTSSGRVAAREYFGLSAHDFVVLFVGKLEPKKRPLDLFRAVANLGQGVSLLVVGSGELEEALREEAQASAIKVSWAGFLNQTELGRAYAAANCLVLPSDWGETWGLVVNEALATGLPCVVSDRVGCAPDLIVPNVTGDIVPVGDPDSLARALDSVRAGVRGGYDWDAACRARVKAYSFEAATAGLLAACHSLTPDRP
jgi:glycosyltransferase involved in cell wall biosynthesis